MNRKKEEKFTIPRVLKFIAILFERKVITPQLTFSVAIVDFEHVNNSWVII